MHENTSRADKLFNFSSFHKINHRIEYLPHTERQQASVLLLDLFTTENVSDRTIEVIPHLRIDILFVLAEREQIQAVILTLLVHVGEVVRALHETTCPLLAMFPKKVRYIGQRHK